MNVPPGLSGAALTLRRFLILMLLLLPGIAPANAQQPTSIEGGPILVLVSRSPADAWAVAQVDGILQVFRDVRPVVTPTIEYMDIQGGITPEAEARLADYYAAKFADRQVRVIAAGDEPAVNFLLKHRERLFPEAEAVAYGISRLEESKRRSWLTAVIEQNDAVGTFRFALRLQPNLRQMVIVDDQAAAGGVLKSRIESTCPEETKQVELSVIAPEKSQDLLDTVAKLPSNSAILLARQRIAPRMLEVLSQHSSVPIYGLRLPIHVPGIVGGALLDGEQHGAAAAGIALRMLRGEKAAAIPIVTDLPPRVVADYHEMQRRNLPFSALPATVSILNQPPTFWDRHSTVILLATAAVAFLAVALVLVLRLYRQNRTTAAKLSDSLSTLNATFDSTSDGMLVVDQAGRVSACNERFLELWNIPSQLSVRMQNDAFLRHAVLQLKDPGAFLARIRDLYTKEEDSFQGELIEFKDGRVFERDSRPLRQGSNIMGRVWSFRDVTARVRADHDRRRLGEQFAQNQKMEALGNLAGGIAHDFNNILTGISGYVELAKARLPGRHPAADDLEHVLRASDRAKELVRQILTFSRKSAPEKRPIPLAPVVRDTLKLLRAVVPASVEIRADLASDAGTVLADPTQVHQAVLNLATNAVHAIGQRPGQIRVSLQHFSVSSDFAALHPPLRPGPHVCLAITDSGHGMDSVTLKRIFEPFFTTKAPGEGTGLGLAVVHAIVQGHEGVLTVDSEPNLGSSFCLYLPVARESQIRPSLDLEETPGGNGQHILVVDDEAMITEVTRCFMEGLGYRVTTANSPEQALTEFLKHPDDFQGLMTDFNMPRMNGLELLRRIRETRPDMPALLCTGFIGSAATESEAADLGVREILGKPFTRHTLGLALERTFHATSLKPEQREPNPRG